jgi:hypothetical protein
MKLQALSVSILAAMLVHSALADDKCSHLSPQQLNNAVRLGHQ